MKKQKLIELANYYGYEWLEDLPHYSNRKGKTYALRDRRTGLIECVYATTAQIETYLKKNTSL